jgi:hypothetical protein
VIRWARCATPFGDALIAATDRGICALSFAGDEAALAAAWREGAARRARAEALRWTEPDWQPRTIAPPIWDELLDLGRAGIAVRRVRPRGDRLELEVATPTS